MQTISCVYCIKHKLDDDWNDIYIGSTCNISQRVKQHKYDCNTDDRHHYNRKVYKYIRENGGWQNFEVLILEECPIEMLIVLEQSYIDVLKPTLNHWNAIKIN